MNRLFVGIAICFLSFGAYGISTRFGAGAPPGSVAYGSEKPHPSATVFGD